MSSKKQTSQQPAKQPDPTPEQVDKVVVLVTELHYAWASKLQKGSKKCKDWDSHFWQMTAELIHILFCAQFHKLPTITLLAV